MPLDKHFSNKNHKWKKVKSITLVHTNREDLIIQQAKCLCGHYIRSKLRRAGLLTRKVTQRLRTIVDVPTSADLGEIFPVLNTMCEELEQMHPRIYVNVSRQISPAPFGELEEAHTAPYLLNIVAKDLLKRNGINWGNIISIFTIAGGLAVDIVRQGHYDYLINLIEGTVDVVEEDLVSWLMDNGGWKGLLVYIRIRSTYHYSQLTVYEWLTVAACSIFIVYLILFIVRTIGKHMYA